MNSHLVSFLDQAWRQIKDPLNFRWLLLCSLLFGICTLSLYLWQQYHHPKIAKARLKHFSDRSLIILSIGSFLIVLFSFIIIIAMPPAVIYPPAPLTDPVLVSSHNPMLIVFNRPISQHIKSSISPSIQGNWQLIPYSYGPWLKNALLFTPSQPLISKNEYYIDLDQILPLLWIDLSSQSQKYLFAFTQSSPFSDLNLLSTSSVSNPNSPLTLLASDPIASASSVPIDTEIKLAFSEPVDITQAQTYISISPAISLSFEQTDSTITLQPNSVLAFDTTYTLTISPGLPASGSATMVQTGTSLQFTTAAKQFRLDVPLYKQHYTFTCYSVAARMALGYRDITISEVGFLDEIGYDTTSRNYVTNTWGDPYKGVVGTYNGSGDGGYGAHWPAVAQAMSKYRQVEIKEHWDITGLLDTVAQGKPVMVWWVNGVWPAKDVSWNNAQGEKVYTVNGMHVEVVTGWVGNQHNPEYILTNDPWRGYRRYTPQSFSNLWKWFDNSAIIVY